MRPRQHQIPRLWLISDARNDGVLETALRRLPRGAGFIYRHYHLPVGERRARFRRLARLARAKGHCVVLAGSAREARAWGADGAYGADLSRRTGGLRLATAHSLRALRRLCHADAVLLSPAYPTHSHPGAPALGPVRFRLISAHSPVAVVALGGLDPRRARRLGAYGWAAIDGLSKRRRRAS